MSKGEKEKRTMLLNLVKSFIADHTWVNNIDKKVYRVTDVFNQQVKTDEWGIFITITDGRTNSKVSVDQLVDQFTINKKKDKTNDED